MTTILPLTPEYKPDRSGTGEALVANLGARRAYRAWKRRAV
jgi:hypothetical protein